MKVIMIHHGWAVIRKQHARAVIRIHHAMAVIRIHQSRAVMEWNELFTKHGFQQTDWLEIDVSLVVVGL